MLIAHRIQQVQDPVIPIIGRLVRENPGTISLGQGMVGYGPPQAVKQAVADSVLGDSGLDQYGPVIGNRDLLGHIEEKLLQENSMQLAAEASSVVFSAGANMGFLSAILAIADVGDEILLLSPYYFNHHMAIEIAGCRPIVVPSEPDHHPNLDAIRAALSPRTRAIVTVSPNNPTGTVYSPGELQAVNEMCAAHGIYHISDEAYEYFVYGSAKHYSPASKAGTGGHTISLFSLSKSYGLAGWRAGYSVIPNRLLDAVQKIQDTNMICPPQVTQIAATAALQVGGAWCRSQVAGLEAVRTQALHELALLGDACQVSESDGAFYLFLKLPPVCSDRTLVEALVRDFGVAALPGSAFGASGCSLRVSYGALDADTVRRGIARLTKGLASILSL